MMYEVSMVARNTECEHCGHISDLHDDCVVDSENEVEAEEDALQWFESEHGIYYKNVDVEHVEIYQEGE